jgi:hypothetical protein
MDYQAKIDYQAEVDDQAEIDYQKCSSNLLTPEVESSITEPSAWSSIKVLLGATPRFSARMLSRLGHLSIQGGQLTVDRRRCGSVDRGPISLRSVAALEYGARYLPL